MTSPPHPCVLLLLAMLLTCPRSSTAASDPEAPTIDALTTFGLRGVWSPDCYRPASTRNPRIKVDTSQFGMVEIRQANETMAVEAAFPLGTDLLALRLSSVTTTQDDSVDRLDVYRKIGNRMQLYNSEVTAASDGAKRRGVVLGKTIVNGASRHPVAGGGFVIPPLLEQCH